MKKIILSSLVIVSLLFSGWQFVKASGDIQLNLSHVTCVDNRVEVHFVLLHAGDYTPSSLTYTYVFNANQPNVTEMRTVDLGKLSGDTWHFTDYVDSGFIDVKTAKVTVNGQVITLHNPDTYVDTYNCNSEQEPTSTPTPKTTDEPATVTPTSTNEVSPPSQPTETPTVIDMPTITETVVTSTPSPTATTPPTNLDILGEPPTIPVHRMFLPIISTGLEK